VGKPRFTLIRGGAEQKNKVEKRRLNPLFYLILVLMGSLLIIQFFTAFGRGFLASGLIETTVLKEGWLEKSMTVPVVLWREEKVNFAPEGGYITWVVNEGQRVSSGSSVIKMANRLPEGMKPTSEEKKTGLLAMLISWLRGEGEDLPEESALPLEEWEIKTNEAGWASFHIDGWENKEWHQLLTLLEEEDPPVDLTRQTGEYVAAGEPLWKLICSHRWLVVTRLYADDVENIINQKNISMTLSFAEDTPLTARLIEMEEQQQGGCVLAWEANRELPGFTYQRLASAKIIYDRAYGCKLAEEFLTEQSGKTGVFVVKQGLARFKPVSVVDKFEGEVLVEGIAPPAMVVTNPSRVEEGQRVR